MAHCVILYWRDIPAQVIAQEGRRQEKRPLSERFMQAIDQCAMNIGAKDSDAYLAHWRRGTAEPCETDLAAAADAAVAAILETYDVNRLRALIANGGQA